MSFEQPNRVVEPRFPLEELSWTLAKNAIVISQYLEAHHLPQPSFNSKGPSVVVPTSSPQAIQEARQKLIAASLEIFHLAVGPSEFLPNLAAGVRSELCLPLSSAEDTLTLPSSNMSPVLTGSVNTTFFTLCH